MQSKRARQCPNISAVAAFDDCDDVRSLWRGRSGTLTHIVKRKLLRSYTWTAERLSTLDSTVAACSPEFELGRFRFCLELWPFGCKRTAAELQSLPEQERKTQQIGVGVQLPKLAGPLLTRTCTILCQRRRPLLCASRLQSRWCRRNWPCLASR